MRNKERLCFVDDSVRRIPPKETEATQRRRIPELTHKRLIASTPHPRTSTQATGKKKRSMKIGDRLVHGGVKRIAQRERHLGQNSGDSPD
ncbi:hypothetical protein MTO96_005333 [Rhipicephalus appendiculatus]